VITAPPYRLPSRSAWLDARRIGSSDVAAVLGLSRWRSPWDVWARLHGLDREKWLDDDDEERLDEEPETPDQARGRALEPRILRAYGRATGGYVAPTPPHTLYAREDHSTSTPDAIRDFEILVEAKSDRFRARWGDPDTIVRWKPNCERIVRRDYYLQVQHQLWTLDAVIGDLAVLVPGRDPFTPELRIYRLHRDEELLDRVIDRIRRWWDVHIVRGDEPPLDGSRTASRILGSIERSGERRAAVHEVALAAAYETARQTERDARTAKERIGQLLVRSAGAERVLLMPRGRVTIVRQAGADGPVVYPRISGVGGSE
jgi:hypothetical protein